MNMTKAMIKAEKERAAQFVQERNEALYSFDKEKILAFIEKWTPDAQVPKDDTVFWAGICKAICNINGVPERVLNKAKKWLYKNGFSERIY